MYKNKIGSLPVVDESGALCGIITDTDIFRALVDIFGLNQNCTRITIDCTDKVGVLAEIGKLFADRNINIISVNTLNNDDGTTEVTIAADLTQAGMDVIEAIREAGYDVTNITTVKAGN
jgi:acetoin utilization protein AcuB